MMKLIKMLILLGLVLVFSSLSFGEDNVVLNGDFTNNLNNWNLEDASFIHNCPVNPYAEAYIADGMAVLHGRSCTVNGFLHQDLPDIIKNPKYFSFEYKLQGSCSAIAGYLFNGGEQVLQLRGHRDSSSCCPSAMTLFYKDQIVWTIRDNYYDAVISPGIFEIYFDYDLMEAKAYINGELKVTFNFEEDIIVDRVSLGNHHNCFDGRNDVYAYFDNVILSGPVDSDGDGIPDSDDGCVNSDLSNTVVIDGCDSGVENIIFDNGCTLSDYIANCAQQANNHGQFVSCVSVLTNDLKDEGKITGKEKGRIQSCAAKADIP